MTHAPNILAIDDDPSVRKTLADILRIKGYEVASAENGASGVAEAQRISASVVLIDLKLPDMSGIEVMEKIKAASPLTEAIILTGHASLDTAVEAINKGAFDKEFVRFLHEVAGDIAIGVHSLNLDKNLHATLDHLRSSMNSTVEAIASMWSCAIPIPRATSGAWRSWLAPSAGKWDCPSDRSKACASSATCTTSARSPCPPKS